MDLICSVLGTVAMLRAVLKLQVFAVNALLNGFDVIAVIPTGSGKTLVIYLFAMALPKMLAVANTMVVVGILQTSSLHSLKVVPPGMPLTMIIQQQLENSFGCPVLGLSMGASVTGSVGPAVAEISSSGESLSVAEASSGKYRILFMHPEASVTESGQRLLRELASTDVIRGLVIDEVHQVQLSFTISFITSSSRLTSALFDHNITPLHPLQNHNINIYTMHFVCNSLQGLEGHWASIRPGLLKDILGVKIHMSKHSPICVLTATITPDELATVKKLMGRRRAPLLVADGPIGSHTKICTVRRPSSDVDFFGRELVDGSKQPGILHLLQFLALDRFLSAFRNGHSFPRTIIYFRCVVY